MCDIVERLAEARRSVLDPALHSMMMHYGRMLRRHVAPDAEIAELCQRIYQSHKRALDLIFEHLPDEQSAMAQFLDDLVASENQFEPRLSGKQDMHFTYREWDRLLNYVGDEWSHNGDLLYFQFQYLPDKFPSWLWSAPARKNSEAD